MKTKAYKYRASFYLNSTKASKPQFVLKHTKEANTIGELNDWAARVRSRRGHRLYVVEIRRIKDSSVVTGYAYGEDPIYDQFKLWMCNMIPDKPQSQSVCAFIKVPKNRMSHYPSSLAVIESSDVETRQDWLAWSRLAREQFEHIKGLGLAMRSAQFHHTYLNAFHYGLHFYTRFYLWHQGKREISYSILFIHE